MKVAALVLAHHRPDCLKILLNRLQGDLWKVYLHIDAKSDTDSFAHLLHLAVPAERRVAVHWGRFSQVDAILVLLKQALSDSKVTHFYVLSGQDYPIKSDSQIREILNLSACGGNYMTLQEMPTQTKPLTRLASRYYFNDLKGGYKAKIHSVLNKVIPKRNLDMHLRGIPPFAGAGMWLINRKTAELIIAFLCENPWFVSAFKHTHCPDEMFFQTIAAHLGVEMDGECPTASFWIQGKAHPEIITPQILEHLHADWHLFARKFDKSYP